MYIVKQKQAHRIDVSDSTMIEEYRMDESAISAATSVISGRYPKKGYATNTVSKEIALVISGSGTIGVSEKTTSIEIGDCIFIDANEKFYWEGNMALFIVTTPKFNSKQHFITL